MSGFEVCRAIKAGETTSNIPVVHTSATSVEPGHRVLGLDSGANGYLAEPVDAEELLAWVRSLLRMKKALDDAGQAGKQWQATFDAVGDAICLLDPEWRVLRANQAFEEMVGEGSHGILGKRCWELVHKTDGPVPGCPFVKMIDSRTRASTLMQADGRWLQVSSSPIFDPRGGVESVVHIISDITDRRLAEERLKQSEKSYREVVQDQTEVICRFMADGTYTFVNDVFCRFFGKPREELLGRRWFPQAHADDLEMIQARLATMSPTSPVVLIENRVVSGQGELRWMQFVNRGFYDPSGKLVEIQSVGRDITDRRRAEEELRRTEQALAAAERVAQVGTFAVDPARSRFAWSDGMFRLHALDPSAGPPKWPGGILALYHPDDRAALLARIDELRHGGPESEAEQRALRPDGSMRWLLVRAQAIRAPDGTVTGIAGAALDITRRKQVEAEREHLVDQLQASLAEIRTLRGLVPICASCKRVRDEQGDWKPIERYISAHTEAECSHSICPECVKRLYPALWPESQR